MEYKYSKQLQEVLAILNGFTRWELEEFLSRLDVLTKYAPISTDKINKEQLESLANS